MSSNVTLTGNPIEVAGSYPKKGQAAPEFSLVGWDLADVTLSSLAGKRKVLNIFPSIATPTCATPVRKFTETRGSCPARALSRHKHSEVPQPACRHRFRHHPGVRPRVGASEVDRPVRNAGLSVTGMHDEGQHTEVVASLKPVRTAAPDPYA